MTYRLIALFFIAVFYFIYFAKMFIQKKKGIVTNQIAKGKTRDKSYYIELIMKVATILVVVVEVASVYVGIARLPIMFRVIGMYFAFLGDLLFLAATITMKDSWRAGVARDDTKDRSLVTDGIYKYSRNPAFLGFDFLYIGITLMFCNWVLVFVSIWAIVMLHLQILQEEKYLLDVHGSVYKEYMDKSSRYAGCGKLTGTKFILYIYFILFVWSVLYSFTCLAYGGGPKLSWVWLWILIAAFSFIRVRMLKKRVDGREKKKLPKLITIVYRSVFAIFLIFFLITEARIIGAMNATPKENLDYIIVLGAGLNGTVPSNPLKARILKAAEYAGDNESTMIVASGGQGNYEDISEAQAIKNSLSQQYGIDEDRIILENRSADTEQNLKYSLEIIGDPDASVGIVTNGFHELRAMSIAREVGYNNVSSVPAKTLFPVGIHYCVREFFGMVEFYIKYRF